MSDDQRQPLTEDQLVGLRKGYVTYLAEPFQTKYEEKFVEAEFWEAVESFKAYAKTLGITEDPIECFRRKGSFKQYEDIRDHFKAGPPACFREGWVSEFIGQTVEVKEVVDKCYYLAGPKYTGEQRVVVFDIWATWCKPCMEAAPLISDLADKYAGKIAVVGINNEAIFGPDKPHDAEKVKAVVEEKKDGMRYTVVIDSESHHIKNDVFLKAGYLGVPCILIIVDNKVSFVGNFESDAFTAALEAGIEATSGPKEE